MRTHAHGLFVSLSVCPFAWSACVQSFVRELQLVVGPLFYVKPNTVGSVVYVHSCPKSTVDDEVLDKVKKWMQTIGV